MKVQPNETDHEFPFASRAYESLGERIAFGVEMNLTRRNVLGIGSAIAAAQPAVGHFVPEG